MLNVTLYRVVTSSELTDIVVTGEYHLEAGGVEGKHFFQSVDDAVRFARRMFHMRPEEGPYTITSITISVFTLKLFGKLAISGEGMAWFAPEILLPLGPVDVWAYCPWERTYET